MQVLARASYLLQVKPDLGMAGSLLAILHAAALGGTDMARLVCSTPKLVRPCRWHSLPSYIVGKQVRTLIK